MDKARAVNLCDLTRFRDPFSPVMLLLRPVLVREQTVHCEKDRVDGMSLLVQPDLDEGRWQAIIELLRNGAGRMKAIPKHALRIYETGNATNKSWKRI